jgi:hypothetical protein
MQASSSKKHTRAKRQTDTCRRIHAAEPGTLSSALLQNVRGPRKIQGHSISQIQATAEVDRQRRASVENVV